MDVLSQPPSREARVQHVRLAAGEVEIVDAAWSGFELTWARGYGARAVLDHIDDRRASGSSLADMARAWVSNFARCKSKIEPRMPCGSAPEASPTSRRVRGVEPVS
jgi:hypothetical protein